MIKESEEFADAWLDAPEFPSDTEADEFPGIATANDHAEAEVDRRWP